MLIFPAVSIANAILEQEPGAEILFVGAEGRMEMQRVPAAGYNIVGLPVRGLLRPLWRPGNVRVLIDFLKSKRMARDTIRQFRPHVAVGVGGYASSATLNAAYDLGVPLLIQEQNSYAGLTNKTLARKADKICVAYEGMERFFPRDRILLTGNPVRQGLVSPTLTKTESSAIFQLDPDFPTVLVIGGSLGARTINESVLASLDLIGQGSVQFIWQTGAHYFEAVQEKLAERGKPKNIYVTDFIARMEQAYKAADMVVSRAGAGSISELCLLGKPSILVPSPNVAEDHQTPNAMALVRNAAAIMVRDTDARRQLIPTALKLAGDKERLKLLGENAHRMAFRDAAAVIAQEVINLARRKGNRHREDGTKRH